MARIEVTIQGVAPLLQHRYPSEKEETKITKVRGARDYSDEAEKALYKNPEGQIYEPSDHVLGALIKASTDFKITGRGKKTYKDLIKSAIIITPDAIPHKYQKWHVDRRAVVVQRARIMRERPMFDEWELSFEVETLDEQLAVPALKEIFEQAGKIGIGDFRPRFGRFMVTEFKEKK
jgi:hypothetical protein